MYGVVFKTENLSNGKLYIGQTIGNKKYYIGSGVYFQKAIQAYGKKTFKRTDLRQCTCQEDLNFWEKHYIKEFSSLRPNGYNLDLGGNSAGCHSKETKEKIRKTNMGHVVTKESKRKMSIACKGRPSPMFGKNHTEESKRKMSEAKMGKSSGMIGKNHTEESKRRMSEAHMGKCYTEKTRKRMSESRKGKKHWNYGKHSSIETRKRMSESKIGSKHTEETKRKISVASKKYWKNR